MIKNSEKYRTADAILLSTKIRKNVSPKAWYLYSTLIEFGGVDLPTDDLITLSGLSKSSYYNALNELVDKGYIKKHQEHDNGRYSFVSFELVEVDNA